MDGLDAASVRRGRRGGPAGRGRPPDDGDQHRPRREAGHQAHGPLVRPDQPAAHRGHRPSAGRRGGDRRVPRRRAELRAAGTGIRAGRLGEDRGRPAGPAAGTARRRRSEAIRHLEDAVLGAGGAVLRYGGLYGPGATDDQVELVRKRQFPLVGGGAGYCSWVHVDDAASATVLAVEQKATGVFNIVDDEPAPASEWLPYLAECAGAKPPMRVPAGWPGCSPGRSR